jgi:hypothetical protein
MKLESILLVSGLTFVGMVGGCTYNHLRDSFMESHEKLTEDHEEAKKKLEDYYDIKNSLMSCEWEKHHLMYKMASNQYEIIIKDKPAKYKVVK